MNLKIILYSFLFVKFMIFIPYMEIEDLDYPNDLIVDPTTYLNIEYKETTSEMTE